MRSGEMTRRQFAPIKSDPLRWARASAGLSLAVFFLPTPSSQPEPLNDFRRFPGVGLPCLSPELLREMWRARRRRTSALELLADLDFSVAPIPLRAARERDGAGFAPAGGVAYATTVGDPSG